MWLLIVTFFNIFEWIFTHNMTKHVADIFIVKHDQNLSGLSCRHESCLVQFQGIALRSHTFYTKFTPPKTPYDQPTVLAGVNKPHWGYRWAISWWDIVSAIKFFTAFPCIQRDVNIPAAPPLDTQSSPPKTVTTVWDARKPFCSRVMFYVFMCHFQVRINPEKVELANLRKFYLPTLLSNK